MNMVRQPVWRSSIARRFAHVCFAVAGCAALAMLAGCASGDAAPQQAATTPHNVTLTKVQRKSIHVQPVAQVAYHMAISTTGVVDFDHNLATHVVAPFSGAVTKVRVTLGQHVKQGQPLATVDSPDFAAALGAYRKAVLAARAADAAATNDRVLYAHKAISERENAQAQADAAGADADRAAAKQALVALHMNAHTIAAIAAGKTPAHGSGIIRAPIAGTVVAKAIAPGQTIAAGSTPCFTIADTSAMWVMARVFGADAGKVAVGDTAGITVGDADKPLAGKVTNVGAVVNPATRSVTARVSVANPHGVLKKDMFVSVDIRSQVQRHGILVPVAAVLRNEQNLPFVYLAASDGGYARRRVTLGARIGDRFVIPSGLAAGDKLVVDGSLFLRFIQSQ